MHVVSHVGPSYTIPDSSHTGLLFASDRVVQLHDAEAIQCHSTPFSQSETIRFAGEVKINQIQSAPHSISCNCTNSMRSHSSWASQQSKTIDLDIAVQVDSVSCN